MTRDKALAVLGNLIDLALNSGGRRGEEETDNKPAIALYESAKQARAYFASLPPKGEVTDSLPGIAHDALFEAGDAVKFYFYADPEDAPSEPQELCLAAGFSDHDKLDLFFHLKANCGCAALNTEKE